MRREDDGTRPVALVYRGPASSPGCPEAVAALLAADGALDVHYVGPVGERRLDAPALACARLYAQPCGGDLAPAWRRLRRVRHDLHDWVDDIDLPRPPGPDGGLALDLARDLLASVLSRS